METPTRERKNEDETLRGELISWANNWKQTHHSDSSGIDDLLKILDEGQPRRLQARDLSYEQCLRVFDLKDTEVNHGWDTKVDPPQWLIDVLARLSAATKFHEYQQSEVYSHLALDELLVAAICEASTEARKAIKEANQARESHPTPELKQAEPPAILLLRTEEAMELRAKLGVEDVIVSGVADYALYYDQPKTDSLATNLIVIEAKRRHCTGTALPQLMAYMGMVHRARKDAGKKNCVVWGFASDGFDFYFCRINNDSEWDKSEMIPFNVAGRSKVFGLVCSMVKAAALSSPSNSPAKGETLRELVFQAFGSRQRAQRCDYEMNEPPYGTPPTYGTLPTLTFQELPEGASIFHLPGFSSPEPDQQSPGTAED